MGHEDVLNNHLPPHVRHMRNTLAETSRAPADAPRGLSGQFYTDNDFFYHEGSKLLREAWHCVGRVDELPNVGDYLTLNIMNEPLIVVRDKERIRVLSNVCRHRGMLVVQGEGNTKRFVCPYHAWSYGTDGALLSAPRMVNASFNPKTCKLVEFACTQRFGFIYVCLLDYPPDIDDELSGLETVIQPYRPEEYRHIHTATEIWKTNWKCLVENFMEGYHLSMVHPQTLHGYTPTSLSKKAASGKSFTSYFANYPESAPSRGMGAPDLDDEARRRSVLFAAFPCHIASISASLLVSYSIRPIDVGSIEVRWTMSVYGEDLDDTMIANRIALWEEVNREDRVKLETMQTTLTSVHALGGPLAGDDYEGTIMDFLRWLATQDNDNSSLNETAEQAS